VPGLAERLVPSFSGLAFRSIRQSKSCDASEAIWIRVDAVELREGVAGCKIKVRLTPSLPVDVMCCVGSDKYPKVPLWLGVENTKHKKSMIVDRSTLISTKMYRQEATCSDY
jgi:hypothetical protein